VLDKPSRPHGSFKTRYDVPDRRSAREVLRQTAEREAEMGDTPDPREPYVDMLSTPGWELALKYVILPYVQRVRKSLLKQVDLPDPERQRLHGSLYTLEHIIEELYKRAQESVPGWVASEFR
jgi:hypothetical protein